MNKRIRVVISGRVQGVFFRAETQKQAERYRINGWVRNLRSGKVEALFEGDEFNIHRMVAWCRNGPPLSHVTGIELFEEPYRAEYDNFSVAFDG